MFYSTNIVFSKPPKGIEGQVIKLKLPKNIDQAVLKMKRDIVFEYDEKQMLKLKCCLLFLCGLSFSEISKELNLSKSTISTYLNDEHLEGLLSFEYQKLFQINKSRLHLESTISKIRKAASVFIEQDGNYQETMQITGFSERSLSRYLNHPELEDILGTTQYEIFLAVKNSQMKEMKQNAGYSRAYQSSLCSAILSLNPNGIVQKRYLRLCEAILIHHIYDLKKLMKLANMTEENIIRYLSEFSRCEMFLPIHVLEALKEKSKVIIKNTFLFQSDYMDMIHFYMSSRYSFEEMAEIMHVSNRNVIDYILTKKAKQLLDETEYQCLRDHAKEVNSLLHHCSKKAYLIKDPRMIEIVKPDIFYVKPEEYCVLSILVDFLMLYDSIQFGQLSESLETIEMNLFGHLSCLEKLLTKEAYRKIKICLDIENLLHGNELQRKNMYIMQIVKTFFMYDLDLEETSKKEGIEVTSLIHILQNDFIRVAYGDTLTGYIEKAIENYQSFYQKEKKEKIYLYHF